MQQNDVSKPPLNAKTTFFLLIVILIDDYTNNVIILLPFSFNTNRFNKEDFFCISFKRSFAFVFSSILRFNSFSFSNGSQSIAVHKQFLRSLLCNISKFRHEVHPFQNSSSCVSSEYGTGS